MTHQRRCAHEIERLLAPQAATTQVLEELEVCSLSVLVQAFVLRYAQLFPDCCIRGGCCCMCNSWVTVNDWSVVATRWFQISVLWVQVSLITLLDYLFLGLGSFFEVIPWFKLFSVLTYCQPLLKWKSVCVHFKLMGKSFSWTVIATSAGRQTQS